MIKYILTSMICLLYWGTTHAQNEKHLRLEAFFDSLYAKKEFNGCVLISENDSVLLKKAYGMADFETGRKLTTNTVFEIASVSKSFTAMGIMQLKEKGLISYEDTLRKFFPELPYRGVKIRHLLNNTSGIPDFLAWSGPDIEEGKIHSNTDIIRILPKRYPATSWQPGTKFGYSNSNYLLLGSILEVVSGQPFGEYLRDHIFAPCGMNSTRFYNRHSPSLPADIAFDYCFDQNKDVVERANVSKKYTLTMAGIYGAYGILSNLEDLYKWDRALATNLLVSKNAISEGFSINSLEQSDQPVLFSLGLPYVFGWILLSDQAGENDMFSSGLYGGFTSLIVRKLSSSQTVIMLSNFYDRTDVMSIMGELEPRL